MKRFISIFLATLTASISTPTLAAEPSSSDNFAQVRGFKVEITNSSGKDVDTAWESVHGGEVIIETTETTIGEDKFQRKPLRSFEFLLQHGADLEKETIVTLVNDCRGKPPCLRNIAIRPIVLGPQTGLISEHNIPIQLPLPVFRFEDCNIVRVAAGLSGFGANSGIDVLVRCHADMGDQEAMRQFNTLSNASKVRHESAMNSIRNIK